MVEKVSLLYNKKDDHNVEIKGFMLVEEIELGYIKPRVVFYLEKEIIDLMDLIEHMRAFDLNVVNITFLIEKLNSALKNSERNNTMGFLKPFELKSDNKNKSSRNKNMMHTLNIQDFERIAINNVGKKIT